jgi:hypothetical protein
MVEGGEAGQQERTSWERTVCLFALKKRDKQQSSLRLRCSFVWKSHSLLRLLVLQQPFFIAGGGLRAAGSAELLGLWHALAASHIHTLIWKLRIRH